MLRFVMLYFFQRSETLLKTGSNSDTPAQLNVSVSSCQVRAFRSHQFKMGTWQRRHDNVNPVPPVLYTLWQGYDKGRLGVRQKLTFE